MICCGVTDTACLPSSRRRCDDYDQHMELVAQVLQRLESAGLKVNPLKCECCVQQTDFLGYCRTMEGIKLWRKKIEAILKMGKPTTIKQLRSYLSAVTYYRGIWPR